MIIYTYETKTKTSCRWEKTSPHCSSPSADLFSHFVLPKNKCFNDFIFRFLVNVSFGSQKTSEKGEKTTHKHPKSSIAQNNYLLSVRHLFLWNWLNHLLILCDGKMAELYMLCWDCRGNWGWVDGVKVMFSGLEVGCYVTCLSLMGSWKTNVGSVWKCFRIFILFWRKKSFLSSFFNFTTS